MLALFAFVSLSAFAIQDSDSMANLSINSTFTTTTDITILANDGRTKIAEHALEGGEVLTCILKTSVSGSQRKIRAATTFVVHGVSILSSGFLHKDGKKILIGFNTKHVDGMECEAGPYFSDNPVVPKIGQMKQALEQVMEFVPANPTEI